MKKMRLILILIILFSMSGSYAIAQDLRIFGFFQTFYRNGYSSESNADVKLGVPINPDGTHTYGLQQFNLMASSNFGSGFSAFVNLEMTNNTDIQRMFGNFVVQEAFVNWKCPSGLINVKFGTFLPKFNSFLEVYNRFPLIPFINRPVVYDPTYYSYFNPDDFFPFKGNLQIWGEVPLNDEYSVEYALYHANPELSYLNQASGGNSGAGGYNQTTTMTGGGRLGVKGMTENFDFNIGASLAMDQDRQDAADLFGFLAASPTNIGDLDRTKLGIDGSFSFMNLTIKGELIMVSYADFTDTQQTAFDAMKAKFDPIKNALNPGTDKALEDFDKQFFYVSAEYAFLEKYSVYGMFGLIEDHAVPLIEGGVQQMSFGATFKPVDNVVIKAQWHNFKLQDDNLLALELDTRQIFFGASVMF